MEFTMKRLEGRVALISGGASGIRKATAKRFIEEGAIVVITDIQDRLGATAVKELSASGGKIKYLHHDAASEDSWKEVITAIEKEHGGLDILFNNAGIGDVLTIEETPMDTYMKTIAVTQNSVFLGMNFAAPLLKKSKFASVINTSSIYGISGGFGASPAYHA